MTITLENESGREFDFPCEQLAAEVIEAALEAEDFPFEAEVNVLLVTNGEIQRINLNTRGIDSPTDVLSFPMLHFETPADFSEAETEEADCFNPESGELVLGDIIISLEKVVEQAEKYGHSQKREYAFLIAHSMLHLMGYDHESPEEAGVMEARQAAILEGLQILR